MYQVFILLLGHLPFFLLFFFTFMENFFLRQSLSKQKRRQMNSFYQQAFSFKYSPCFHRRTIKSHRSFLSFSPGKESGLAPPSRSALVPCPRLPDAPDAQLLFSCKTSWGCVHHKFVCDNVPHCEDESDEHPDLCGNGNYR